MEAGAELEQRADPTADLDVAAGRLDDPREQAEERRLAGAVAADQADGVSGLDGEGHVLEGPDLCGLRRAASEDEVLQRPALPRVDLEAARDAVDRDLARSHPADDGSGSRRRTSPASTRPKAGSAFGISIRSRRIPSSRAFSCASVSMSQRISRWSETKPIGQTGHCRAPLLG